MASQVAARTTPWNIVRSCKIFRDKVFINGEWTTALSEKSFPVTHPPTQEVIANVPDLNRVDVAEAIGKAHAAYNDWKNESMRVRSALLREFSSRLRSNIDDICTIMTAESGKTLAESEDEARFAANCLEWFSEEAKRIDGDLYAIAEKGTRRLMIKQPIGVSTLISPWNFPLSMLARKMGAALAAGCSVVMKPSEETPLTALALAHLAQDSGLPGGLVSAVTCSRDNVQEVGDELATNPLVRALSFTGSTEAGKWLLQKCAGTVTRTAMELGGSCPFIVFNAADIDNAVNCLVKWKFRNTGQACVSPDRVFLEKGIHDEFIEKLTERVSHLKTGDPFQRDNDLSCLINEMAINKIERHQSDALAKGAELVLGGARHPAGKLFYEPTILDNCSSDMLIMNEESFGPVVPIMQFDGEDNGVFLANDTSMGLAGYMFTNDQKQIWRVAERLQTGMVGINETAIIAEFIPFGGIKESGLGREGSKYGVDEYLEMKYLCMGNL